MPDKGFSTVTITAKAYKKAKAIIERMKGTGIRHFRSIGSFVTYLIMNFKEKEEKCQVGSEKKS